MPRYNNVHTTTTKLMSTMKQALTCDRVVWQIFHQHVLVFCQSSHKPAALARKITADS